MPTDPNSLKVNGYGLVPIEMLKSEGGVGVVTGEIRGVSQETAARMIDLGSAKLYALTKEEQASLTKDLSDARRVADAISAKSTV